MMKKLMMMIIAMSAMTAQAGVLGVYPKMNGAEHGVKKLSKSATTITPNPTKPNQIYKTKKSEAHKAAGEPVASLNAPTPVFGCQEKVVQPCKK